MVIVRTTVLLLGALCIGALLVLLLEWHRVQAWATTQGTIENQYIETFGSGLPSKAGPTNIYSVEVYYSYSVDGKHYIGNRVSLWEAGFTSQAKAHQEMASRSKGSLVTVHYAPEQPDKAVLTIALPIEPMIVLFLTGLILLAVGAQLPAIIQLMLRSIRM